MDQNVSDALDAVERADALREQRTRAFMTGYLDDIERVISNLAGLEVLKLSGHAFRDLTGDAADANPTTE